MASSQELNAKVRKSIASQTASLMAATDPSRGQRHLKKGLGAKAGAKETAPSLAEDFDYLVLSVEGLAKPPKDLAGLLKPTGTHLHLVRSGNQANYFSLSDETNQVHTLTRGDLPQKIFNAVRWLDQRDEADNNDLVSVLSIPALYIYALVVQRPKEPTAIVISAPDDLKLMKDEQLEEVALSKLLKRLQKPAEKVELAQAENKEKAVYG